MISRFKLKIFGCLALLLTLAGSQPASGCAMCFSQLGSDSPLAEGMKWGVISLLAVVLMVLSCFAAFFIYLARRAAAVAAVSAEGQNAISNHKA